jgi:hypothetical protein
MVRTLAIRAGAIDRARTDAPSRVSAASRSAGLLGGLAATHVVGAAVQPPGMKLGWLVARSS